MQVVPMKPKLKASGSKRLKLKSDTLPSNFAFNFNLRRFNEGQRGRDADAARERAAGAYTRPLFGST